MQMKNLTIGYLISYDMNLFQYCTNNIIFLNDEEEAKELVNVLCSIYTRINQLIKNDIPPNHIKNIIREEYPDTYMLYPLKNHSNMLTPFWVESIFYIEKVFTKNTNLTKL